VCSTSTSAGITTGRMSSVVMLHVPSAFQYIVTREWLISDVLNIRDSSCEVVIPF
jgi:hypothetical protein